MSAKKTNRGASGCCLGCFSLLALGAGLLTLLLIGANVGFDGLLVGLVMACLPVPLYVGLALWIDRYEPEPPHLLLMAFMWGACLAVCASYILNTINSVYFYQATHDAAAASALGGIISAPIVEESTKGLCLFFLFFWKRKEFDGIVDGVVYATMVALGFAMTENIQYYGSAIRSGGDAAGALFVLRGMMSPYSHPLFTSMTGIGLGWAAQSDRWLVKLFAPVTGLFLAMALHATWNLTATVHIQAWLAAYALVMMPAALGVGIVVLFALGREGRLLRKHLAHDMSPSELSSVSSVWGRIGYSIGKLFRKGPGGWLASEQFLQVASELAFLRNRTERGFSQEIDHEQDLLMRMQQLRARL
ncbi:PrsW family intramembrane metalloprotease [bacterium]|nr:PrsW family intramembrane metalloprotease [bacterium]